MILQTLFSARCQIIYLSFDVWKKMMVEQTKIINDAFRSQWQMLNDAIKDFSENNPGMVSNFVRQQAEIFNQIIQHQSQIFSDAMKQFDERKTKALQDKNNLSSNKTNKKRQKRGRQR